MATFVNTMNQPTTPKPNWLASEVGLRLVSYMLKSADVTAGTDGKKIVKPGQILPSNDQDAIGLLYTTTDIDVTNGDMAVSLMIGGRVIEQRLPDTVDAAAKTALKAGAALIIFETMATTTRPGSAPVDTTPLATPINLDYSTKVTWDAVTGATSYDVYVDGDTENPANVATAEFAVTDLDVGAHTVIVVAKRGDEVSNPSASYAFTKA